MFHGSSSKPTANSGRHHECAQQHVYSRGKRPHYEIDDSQEESEEEGDEQDEDAEDEDDEEGFIERVRKVKMERFQEPSEEYDRPSKKLRIVVTPEKSVVSSIPSR
jgi:hypothetical protein